MCVNVVKFEQKGQKGSLNFDVAEEGLQLRFKP